MIQTANRIGQVEEYYFSKKLAEVRGLDSPDLRVINLGIGSPDQPPATSTIEALIKAANHPGNHGYQSYRGIPALRSAIAKFCKNTYQVTLDPETMILPLMGSKEGIMHISMAFLNEGEEVLVPDPGYPTYSSVTKLIGGKIKHYHHRENLDWGIDLEELQKSDLSNVKIMWVNTPHMPTGRVSSTQELKALVDLAIENEFLIVNDNPYSLILNKHPMSLLAIPGAEKVALELNSLSKSHNMAGWRVGWVAGAKSFIDATLRVKSNMDSGMFLGIQEAAAEALAHNEAWFEEVNSLYAKRKDWAKKILNRLGCSMAEEQAGMFVWAKAPNTVPSIEKWIDEILYGTKVFITPGFIFGDSGKRYVRISLCSNEEDMKEALDRISAFVEKNT